MGASRYERTLRATYDACRRGRKKLKFWNQRHLKGVPAVIVCDNDEFHALFITPNGGVSFHNHIVKELHNCVTMDKLAHTELKDSALDGCALLLRGLKDIPNGQSYPEAVRYNMGTSALFGKIAEVLVPIGANRNKLREASNQKENGMLDTVTKQAKNDIKELAERLTYRTPKNTGWNKPHYKDMNPGVPEPNDAGISYELELVTNSLVPCSASSDLWKGKVQYRRDSKPIWVRFKAQLNLVWYLKLFKKGLAVIDGMLVLEHTKTFPNGLLLLKVVRQGYGFTVNTVPAIFDPVRQKLSWVNNEEKATKLEDGDKVPRIRRTKAEMLGSPSAETEVK